MIEQHYVIKFFADEGCTGIEIHKRPKDHYEDSAMSRGGPSRSCVGFPRKVLRLAPFLNLKSFRGPFFPPLISLIHL
jgi:hypothetical protein